MRKKQLSHIINNLFCSVPNATEPAGFTDGDIQLILGDSDVCDNVAGTVESECIATRYSQGFSFEITNFTKCSPTYKSQNNVCF